MQAPKFANVKDSFHVVLKNKVQEYFNQTGKKMTGNLALYVKATLLFVLFVSVYTHVVFFTPDLWVAVFECALLGGTIAGIGFNIMHDGAHGSFSSSPFINKVAAITLNVLGGNAFMWNIKHNIIHHAYTNVDGVDDDLDAGPILRMATTQKKYFYHRFQHVYFWFVYCILYLYWVFVSDYKKYFTKKIQSMPLKKMKLADHLTFWGYKIFFYSVFIVVPILTVGWFNWMVGFLTMTIVAGFILSIVFQLAHTVEHTHFPQPSVDDNRLNDEWAIHQLKTTANFATRNKLICWYVGGLNFQIEHHLFPKISHIHYPAISKIIREVCQEYGVQYVEYRRMRQAIASHVMYLKTTGQAA
jgi:linoleoyl-CoA desaturase